MRHPTVRRCLVGVGVFLLLAPPIAGQADHSFGDRIDVHLVTIEVAVESRFSNRPIADLEWEDFQVFEDGEARPITHFERVREGRIELAQGPGGEPRAVAIERARVPRFVALAFDYSSLKLPYLARTVRAAREFVAGDDDPAAQFSVMILGKRPDVLQPFTADRTRVLDALDALEPLRKGLYPDTQGLAFDLPRRFLDEDSDGESGGEGWNAAREAEDDMSAFLAAAEASTCFHAAFSYGRRLSELFQGWPGGEGSRSLMLFYERHQSCGATGGPEVRRSKVVQSKPHQIADFYDLVSRHAVAAGVKVYASQGTGLLNPAKDRSASLSNLPPGALARQVYVDQVTDRTGGRHVNLNELERALDMAATTSSNHYRISFQVDRAPDNQAHDLEVRVAGVAGPAVRYPSTYQDIDGRSRLERQLHTSAHIPKHGGSLPVSLRIRVSPTEQGRMPVQASIVVPEDAVGRLWSADTGELAEIDWYLAIYDATGELMQVETDPGTPDDGGPDRFAFRQAFSFSLPMGTYTVAVGALDTVSGRYGLDFAEIHP